MEKQTKFNIWYVLIAMMAIVWLRDAWVGVNQVQPIPYSEFQHHLKAGDLEEIAISNNVIQGKLKNPPLTGARESSPRGWTRSSPRSFPSTM